MRFTKMEGLGNDFVVLDGPFTPSPQQVAAWCDRRRGIGADGVLVVTPGDPLVMEYWNADGSPAEMCGNGLRCVARYARERGLVAGNQFTVDTPIGIRPVEVAAETVRVLLGTVDGDGSERLIAGNEVRTARIGNPHAVIRVDDPAAAPVAEIGPEVAAHEMFPEGTNVEFMAVTDAAHIDLRVWERGVGETLACGSGAAAAVAVAHEAGWCDSSVAVTLPGGELQVELTAEGAWLEGPARIVFAGELA